ncbi:hypothetical protein Taro_016110 [Colocasia esculenta]|uniref:Uncharacterized protein n=1 Tax=Colocasia esculenta TaxID=4460 RepID=A0A843UVA4_COLES|nr:hypothetical protein [Colocasia esculenta]
MSPQTGGLF